MTKSNSTKTKRKSVVEETLLVKVVERYARLAGIFTSVWLLGYFRFSVTWIWVGLVVYVWAERHRRARENRTRISQEIARDEKSVILARVEDLPSWVNFPDVERAEWVNRMIRQLWPYVAEYVEKMLRGSVEPTLKKSLPPSLKSFSFSSVNLGDIPPRIGGVKVYSQLKRDEIYMDLDINYSSDCDIAVSVKGINAGIKDFRLQGILRVVFKPLINKPPLIGGLRIFFLNNPDVEFHLTSLASAFDLPGLSDMLHSIVQEQIANRMVLPNCIPIKLTDGLDINKLRYPQPQGVIRVKIVEAKELIEADFSLTGRGSSDPYAIVKLGSKEFRTRIIPKSLNPVWNETFELVVDSADGQLLHLDVFDDDQGSKDDFLGRAQMDLSQLKEDGFADEWLPLDDVKQGMIHIQLTWLWLANDPLELGKTFYQVTQDNHQDKTLEENNTHVAMLLVFLDSATNLPTERGRKTLTEPSPQVSLMVGQQTAESKVKVNTNEPRWEESFRFMLHNLGQQNLEVEIKDTKTKKTIGHTQVKVRELLDAEDLVVDQKFPISTADPDSYLSMRLALRILTPRADPKWTEKEEDLLDESADGKKKEPKARKPKETEKPESASPKKENVVPDSEEASATEKATLVRQSTTEKTVVEDAKTQLEDAVDAKSLVPEIPTEPKESATAEKKKASTVPGGDETPNEKEVSRDPKETAEQKKEVVDIKGKEETSTETTTSTETQSHSETESYHEVKIEIEDRKEEPTMTAVENFNPGSDADEISKAMKTFGMDEDAVINIFGKRTLQQRHEIAVDYNTKYQKDLSKDLSSKLRGSFKTLCLELLLGRDEFDAKQLYKAMKGLGSNEQVMVEIICTRSNDQLNRIKAAYKRMYDKDLDAAVADDTSGDFQRLLLGCLEAKRAEGAEFDRNKARRDAQDLVSAGEKTWGTQESTFQRILVSCSYAQLRATFEEYHKLTNKDIEDTIRSEMSGDLKNGMLTIVQMIRRKEQYFAQALHKAMKGFGTDDDTLIRVIASRSEVDMVQIKEEYLREFKQTLGSAIVGDTNGDYRKMLLALIGDEDAKK